MKYTHPETLPTDIAGLDELAEQARAEIGVFRARAAAKDDLTAEDADRLQYLLDSLDAVESARDAAAAAELSDAERLSSLLDRAGTATTPPAAPVEPEPVAEVTAEDAAEVVAEAEAAVAETAEPVAAAASRPVSFAHAAPAATPTVDRTPGWELLPSAPGYKAGAGRVGFRDIALAIDSVRPGGMTGMQATGTRNGMATQSFASLRRDLPVVEDAHALVAAIEEATSQIPGHGKVTAQALTAAGGWCAPSEQLFDFCDVPDAVDLLSLPEITIRRGGVRWPVEPDVSALLTDDAFLFHFTEPELEATDGNGNPTAEKHCIEVPCPDEFKELRLEAIGYCVKAGILQQQGWPELIEWFLRTFAAAHLRAVSAITIRRMAADSRALSIPAALGATSSVLNALDLMATNLRLQKGLSRTAPIEGVAPSWLPAVLRADLAMMGADDGGFDVTDAQVNAWLTSRNIALQYVADWQTRDAGKPGNLATLAWPGTVNVLLYPAGTWFRAMSEVITIGTAYYPELLKYNRYSALFTEDAYTVGRRCNESLNVEIPLCVSGAVGARQTVDCNKA